MIQDGQIFIKSGRQMYFQTTCAFEEKMGINAMKLWIETAEFMFQKTLEKEGESKILWHFPLKEHYKQMNCLRKENNKKTKKRNKTSKSNYAQYKQITLDCCRLQGS